MTSRRLPKLFTWEPRMAWLWSLHRITTQHHNPCSRLEWFRTLLAEKAHSFQIVVFTCRPGDYLLASDLVPQGSVVHADTDGGFIRAIDLVRVLRRR